MLIADGGGGSVSSNAPVKNVFGVNLGAGLGVVDGVISGAVEIALDVAQVAKINGHLTEAEEAIAEVKNQLHVVTPGSVGGSPVGKQLSHHSELATQALLETLAKMEQGVIYYRDAIEAAVSKLLGADEEAGVVTKKGQGLIEAQPGQGGNG